MRKWVFMFFVLNLVLLLSWISGLPKQTFDLLGIYLIHSSLMALAIVLLSFWVWKDGNEIEHLHERIDRILREVKKKTEMDVQERG